MNKNMYTVLVMPVRSVQNVTTTTIMINVLERDGNLRAIISFENKIIESFEPYWV